jgi:hypothetical protein
MDLPPGWFDRPSEQEVAAAASAVRRGPAPAASPASNPEKAKCSCGEWIGWTDAVCWKCGRPNEVARARADRQREQSTVQELQKLAAQMDPKKKKPWWKLR